MQHDFICSHCPRDVEIIEGDNAHLIKFIATIRHERSLNVQNKFTI